MKFNKWTLGLAAIGVVSLASAAKADEQMTAIQSAMSSTTISGYVDTSVHWNLGTGNNGVGWAFAQGPGKSDGFNLNVVQLTIAKPLDEADWAAGYRADLWFGPDANSLETQSIFANGGWAAQGDFGIRQAYVALRTPIGNGIEWKLGVFDTIIGYESLESGNNPNYTRSLGNFIEPRTHTGVLATYRINDVISLSAGIANTWGASINERAHGPNTAPPFVRADAESYKTYMGSIALTAPESWGWAAGSTLYAGVVNGFSARFVDNVTSWYAGGTLATPVAGLKVGAAFDYLDAHNFPSDSDSIWVIGGYASYQATEKLSFHLRGEYLNGAIPGDDVKLYELTATIQYDLWKNVISRLEFRWDHADAPAGFSPFGGQTGNGTSYYDDDFFPVSTGGKALETEPLEYYHSSDAAIDWASPSNYSYGNSPDRNNAFLLALNVIYKF